MSKDAYLIGETISISASGTGGAGGTKTYFEVQLKNPSAVVVKSQRFSGTSFTGTVTYTLSPTDAAGTWTAVTNYCVVGGKSTKVTKLAQDTATVTAGVPDVRAIDIWTTPTPPVGSQWTTVSWQIGTDSVPFATSIVNVLRIDGVAVDTRTLAGSSGASTITYTYTTSTLGTGWHTIMAFADSTHLLTESNENNNVYGENFWFESPIPPDVSAVDIWTDPVAPVDSAPVRIYYSIATDAYMFLTSINTDLYIDNVKVSTQVLAGSGGANTITYSYDTTASAGAHVLKIVTDATNALVESSETNNQRTETITWLPKADVAAVDIWTSPASPVGGQSAIIYYSISTTSTPFTESIYTDLTIDNILSDRKLLSGSTGAQTITYSYTATLGPGNHVIKIAIDVANVLVESNELNNQRTETLAWTGPDVSATDIWTDPNPPVGDMEGWVFFSLTTNSVPFSTTIYVNIYADGVLLGSDSMSGSPGAGTSTFVEKYLLGPGSHTLWLVVDATGALAETDETNNERTEVITWTAGAPDLIVTDIWTDPVYPLMDAPATIYYEIKNIGVGTAVPQSGTFWTSLTLGTSVVHSFSLTTLAPGATAQGAYTTTLTIGSYTLYVRTDVGRFGQVDESNENNNDRTEVIRWHEPFSDSDGDGLGDIVEIDIGTNQYGYDKWAIVIVGGWGVYANQPPWQIAFLNDATVVYETLLDAGYPSSHIYVISKLSLTTTIGNIAPNAEPTRAAVETAIYSSSGWLRTHADADDSVFFYLTDHGRQDDGHFLLDGLDQENPVFITDEEVGTWVDAVTCWRLTFVIDCCYAGNWIDDLDDAHHNERIILTATSADLPGYMINPDGLSNSGDEFSVYTMYLVGELMGTTVIQAHYWAAGHVNAWAAGAGVVYQEPQIFSSGLSWFLW